MERKPKVPELDKFTPHGCWVDLSVENPKLLVSIAGVKHTIDLSPLKVVGAKT